MHELGIIVHIAKTLDQVAAENELKKIGSVTLDIGEVSGIVPEYLTECWEFYRKKNPLIAECEMKIESLPAVTICDIGISANCSTSIPNRINPMSLYT